MAGLIIIIGSMVAIVIGTFYLVWRENTQTIWACRRVNARLKDILDRELER